MLKKLLILSLMLLFASSLVNAQTRAILKADGDLVKLRSAQDMQEAIKVTKMTNLSGQAVEGNVFLKPANINGTADTMSYGGLAPFNTNFGMNGGDVMMQYFVAPADLLIHGAGFTVSDAEGAATSTVSLRLVKLNWTYEQLTGVPAPLNMGVYPAVGDGAGEIDYFGENATGTWTDFSEGAYPLPPWTDNIDAGANGWSYDLWSDEGFGWPVTAVASELNSKVYNWVDMSGLFTPDTIRTGEVFAVVMTHDGAMGAAADRIGYWSDNTIGIPGWKYYEAGRLAAGDGWFARAYTWDFAVAVEIVSDRPPVISGINRLLTTVDTGPLSVSATITDDNPSEGPAGVATAELNYSLDTGKTWQSVAMTASGDVYSGDIPGQSPGTLITYKVKATDVEGLFTESGSSSYSIFETVNKDLLVIFNGGSEGRAKQLVGFYINGLVPKFDLWAAFGPVGDFINFYDAILEISAEGGAVDDNRAAITAYLATGGKTLGVVGQEVLGYLNGFTDSTFIAGDYEYDVLGVKTSYNDVNYGGEFGVDNVAPSKVNPVAGSTYGDALAQWLTDNALDTLWYYPTDILGSDNWMDQFDSRDDIGSEVFITSIALDGTERSAGHNYTDGNANKIFFSSVDDLSFEADSGWVGNSTLTPLRQFIAANIIVGVEVIDNNVPKSFELSQNYPNPFNPSTKINFSLVKSGLTSLTVYNVLGQEVATLVNKELAAGAYSINFDASNLSSGMYLYTIKTGNVEITKKMMILK